MFRLMMILIVAFSFMFTACDEKQSTRGDAPEIIREEIDMGSGIEAGEMAGEEVIAGEMAGEMTEMDAGLPDEGPIAGEMDMMPEAGEEPIEEVEPPLPG